MSGAGRGVNRNTPNTDRPDRGRGAPCPTKEDTPGPVVYRILNGRLAEVGAYAKTPNPGPPRHAKVKLPVYF